jgi:hypothetical protein
VLRYLPCAASRRRQEEAEVGSSLEEAEVGPRSGRVESGAAPPPPQWELGRGVEGGRRTGSQEKWRGSGEERRELVREIDGGRWERRALGWERERGEMKKRERSG